AADGKTAWDVEVFRPDPASVRAMHQKNSAASATALVVGDRLYAHFGHLGTAALDLAGKVLWRQTTLTYPPVHGNGGSPVLVGDVTNSHVAWTMRKGAPTTPSPVVVGDEVYLVSDGGIATCADVKTGRTHWTHRFDGGFSASPVAAEGRVYFQNESGVGFVVEA